MPTTRSHVLRTGRVDSCLSSPCHNGGRCTSYGRYYICRCSSGFHGLRCDVGVTCDCRQPCQNDGVCFNDTCICSTNYTGSECQFRHPCSSSPCLNGGNCSKRGDKYRCVCPADFSGSHCEWVNRCKSSPCLNAGSCRTWESRYFCICSSAFTGSNCEHARSTSPAPTSTRLPHTHTHSSSLVLLAVVAVLLALVVVTTLGWCCWCKVRRRYLGCTLPAGGQDAVTRVHIPGFSFSQLLESQGSGEVQGGFYPVWTTPPSYCSLQGDTKPLEFPPPYDELALDAIATPAGGETFAGGRELGVDTVTSPAPRELSVVGSTELSVPPEEAARMSEELTEGKSGGAEVSHTPDQQSAVKTDISDV